MFLQILPDRGIFLLCNTCIFVGELDLSRLVPLELWLNQQHFFCAKFGLIHSFSICLLSTDKDDLGTVSYFAHVVYHGKEPRFLLPWIPPGFRQGETLVKRWEKWGGRGEAWLALWFSPCPRQLLCNSCVHLPMAPALPWPPIVVPASIRWTWPLDYGSTTPSICPSSLGMMPAC